MKQQTKIVTLYCRLSRDDESEGYSSSIMSQKQILSQYTKQNGMTETEFFIDDEYSGTNFQRPGWQELIARVENGEVSAIICKDSSRMARNYLQAGLYRDGDVKHKLKKSEIIYNQFIKTLTTPAKQADGLTPTYLFCFIAS